MFAGIRSRPLRTVIQWQLIATALLALVAGFAWGLHGAVSAILGGLVNVVAGWAYGWLVTRKEAPSAGQALRTMFRAEGVKILLVIVQLWLVLSLYREIEVVGFLAAFVVAVGVSTMAIAVKDA